MDPILRAIVYLFDCRQFDVVRPHDDFARPGRERFHFGPHQVAQLELAERGLQKEEKHLFSDVTTCHK